MILSFINIRKVPREMLKTSGSSGFALGFQHLPRDLANVNEWKIMFDPFNKIYFHLLPVMMVSSGENKTFAYHDGQIYSYITIIDSDVKQQNKQTH